MRTTVRTYSGKSLDLLRPDPAQICIEDIAHHLSMLNRYNGACPYPFSVAQHSLYVAAILPAPLKLWGLLHDAPEAYLGDLVSPAKHIDSLAEFKRLESGIMDAVALAFQLAPAYVKIHAYDCAVTLRHGVLHAAPMAMDGMIIEADEYRIEKPFSEKFLAIVNGVLGTHFTMADF